MILSASVLKAAIENKTIDFFDLNKVFINLSSINVNIVGEVLINNRWLIIKVDFAVLSNLEINEFPNGSRRQYQLAGNIGNHSVNGFWSVFKYRNYGATGNGTDALFLSVLDVAQYDYTNGDILENYLGY